VNSRAGLDVLIMQRCFCVENVWGSGGIEAHIINLGEVSFTPLPICPRGKSLLCPVDERLSGP
jgi:hypothetical protein